MKLNSESHKGKAILMGCLVAFTIFFIPDSLAQRDSITKKNDTLRFNTRQVVVDAKRISLQNEAISAQPTTMLLRDEIIANGSLQTADLLATLPGIFITNYGGLGGIKTISLRGATASQTAIVLDGIRISSSQNGLTDLSLVPSSLLNDVTVLRGGASSHVGTNAIGGAVLLTSRQPDCDSSTYLIRAGYGSFGEYSVRTSVNQMLSQHSALRADGEYMRSAGDYPFVFNQFGNNETLRRTNGDAENVMVMVSGIIPIQKSQSSNPIMRVFVRSSRRGAPGAVLQGAVENSLARLYDDEGVAILRWQHQYEAVQNPSNWSKQFDLRAFARAGNQEFYDPLFPGGGMNGRTDFFRSRDAAVAATLTMRHLPSVSTLEIHAESYYHHLSGSLLRIGSGSLAERLQIAVAASLTTTQMLIRDTTSPFNGLNVTANAALRADYFSDVYSVLSPIVNLRCAKEGIPVLLRGQVSYNFRPPSFNELYYQNYGNIALKPERSLSVEAGITYSPTQALNMMFNLFFVNTTDQIAAVPRNAIAWSAENIAHVVNNGYEVVINYSVMPVLLLRAGYTYQNTVNMEQKDYLRGKRILYTPAHIGSLSATTTLGKASCSLTAQYSGARYSQPDNAPESLMPQFLTVNAGLWYAIPLSNSTISLRLDAINLFDAQYSIINNFPMPGRQYRLSLQAEFGS